MPPWCLHELSGAVGLTAAGTLSSRVSRRRRGAVQHTPHRDWGVRGGMHALPVCYNRKTPSNRHEAACMHEENGVQAPPPPRRRHLQTTQACAPCASSTAHVRALMQQLGQW
jgi:hypothetical protein